MPGAHAKREPPNAAASDGRWEVRRVRIAIFGAGRIGPLHARTLLEHEAVQRLTITDVVAERAERAAQELGIDAVSSMDEALDGADAAVITVSTEGHPALIRAALAHGLPTFCEKPLAASLAESVALMAEVEASGVPFQLGFQRRFDPAYVEARRLIASGELGSLYMLSLRSHDPEPASEEFIASSGGMFSDLSIHDLDVLRYLTGSEVEEVFCLGSARGFPLYEKYDDYAMAVAAMKLVDGTPVVLSWARHDPLGHDVRTEIFGSRDSVSVGVGPRMPLRSLEPGVPPPAGPPWHIFLDRWDDAYHDEMIAFIDVARGKRVSPCSARDGVEALRIAEALAIAAAEHRLVALAEITA
jgi:myo-inositol 2-dehydrogenase/D-chiro-inositol 1-dehydrogenase